MTVNNPSISVQLIIGGIIVLTLAFAWVLARYFLTPSDWWEKSPPDESKQDQNHKGSKH